eukprot:CAMPEP_0170555404 /NCGR_PEP_ID=MMETSP0211-20121228/13300_1 /TAXON_ID=311385 /ORGANISM="Pseudokeronopsis sp., Strain OXSARD2" /LENGTH=63 /DNA_ID=CAMNT_0010865213 /DNA_START=16 /DNA_END=203 /DNA_ORIENTATION=+
MLKVPTSKVEEEKEEFNVEERLEVLKKLSQIYTPGEHTIVGRKKEEEAVASFIQSNVDEKKNG